MTEKLYFWRLAKEKTEPLPEELKHKLRELSHLIDNKELAQLLGYKSRDWNMYQLLNRKRIAKWKLSRLKEYIAKKEKENKCSANSSIS